jgi:hypothetical protein
LKIDLNIQIQTKALKMKDFLNDSEKDFKIKFKYF